MDNIKTVLFDLDGTLLRCEGDDFERTYMTTLANFFKDTINPRELGTHLWATVEAMVKDTSGLTNKDFFYKTFEEKVGSEIFKKLEPHFDTYYETDFDTVKEVMHRSDEMVAVVRYLQSKNIPLILATNPLLPRIGTNKRIAWAGFTPEDFKYVTRFETEKYCKPNLEYYQEILDKHHLKPEECLMIGNDVEEDLVARKLGMKVWLVDDNIIHRGSDLKWDWRGSRKELLDEIKRKF